MSPGHNLKTGFEQTGYPKILTRNVLGKNGRGGGDS